MKTILLILLIAAHPAMAQKESPQARFVAQHLPGNLGNVVAAGVAKEGQEEPLSEQFVLPANNLSESLDMPSRAFVLRTAVGQKSLSRIRIPENGDKFIILLVPGTEQTFDGIVIPDDAGSFKVGEYYFHNGSSQTVLAIIGKTRVAFPPREGRVIRPVGDIDGNYYNVALATRKGGQTTEISESRWPLSKSNRTYVFFFDSPTDGRLRFRSVDEYVPKKR